MAAISTSSGAGSLVPTTGDFSNPDDLFNTIGKGASNLANQGSALTSSGLGVLQPVIARLTKLLSGDQQTIDEAIAPQIRGIVQAYDASRRSTAQFTPRGGGQTSALIQSRTDEAGKISDARSQAQQGATGELAQIGLSEAGLGTEQQQAGLQGILGMLQGAITERGQNLSLWGDIGKGAGEILGKILPRILFGG